MKPVILPEGYNYIAAFLTLSCGLRCGYCINRHNGAPHRNGFIKGSEWIAGINRIAPRRGLPVTLQGGEPSLHPDFIEIINGIKPGLSIDILTNLEFDVDEFIRAVPPSRLRRNAPYASIRASYHPETMRIAQLMEKVVKMTDAGFSVGVWGVLHPAQTAEILRAEKLCASRGIDFRVKEFLGVHNGGLYGTYGFDGACAMRFRKAALCRTTELIIGGNGSVYRCHADLYEGRAPVGNILSPEFAIEDIYRPCSEFGHCNPCDVKLKTDRFQRPGHTSVNIMICGAVH